MCESRAPINPKGFRKMAEFKLSAFADEYSQSIDEQIKALCEHGIPYVELRGVDGTNCADITEDKAREIKAKFDAAGIKVWSIGSPIGKINIKDDMAPHMEKLAHVIRIAKLLGCPRIRMFSFYLDEGEDKTAVRGEVMARLEKMTALAESEGVLLCHENEKGIYGDDAESCLDIYKTLGGRLGVIFDPANFIQVGCEPYPHAFSMLGDKLAYMHIKDALNSDGSVVPAGMGNGEIPKILSEINKNYKGEFVLTLEPHLKVFDGLSGLEREGETTVVRENVYKNASEAFAAAVGALKKILAEL